ncbi:bifunctional 2-methylcitrate dehydratase/aconitate hydratase [Gammaproteobacteria bacterium]|nr:bifunctional 2-methylcitrate dehydratase/aconitate hydratase [Gammaproteobacteria bacterium]
MSHHADNAQRPDHDPELLAIADYILDDSPPSDLARHTARHCLMDTIACAMLALEFPECTKHLGPVVPGTIVPNGARVPGTSYELDPIKAASDFGMMLRWLDFNDTWLAAEWGHPSDNLAAILMLADYLSRQRRLINEAPLTMGDVLNLMIKAHEVQGILALENSFNRVGLDHVLLVKLASAVVCAKMLGQTREQIADTASHAMVDGHALRTYRHAPNAGSRKSWAAGDASARGLKLAMMVSAGEMGIPTAISAKGWGFSDICFKGKPLERKREYGDYVMENILFKISYPAEFHAQTAVECAVALHDQVKGRIDQIERIEMQTQEPGVRIISKDGPLANPADRDHCLQYMVAVPLIHGALTAEMYEDGFAADPRIDTLRDKMQVSENARFTKEYYDLDKRAIGNSIQVFFTDGSSTEKVSIDYPIGHRRRREEGIPVLEQKFVAAIGRRFAKGRVRDMDLLCRDHGELGETEVDRFVWALRG